MIAWLSVTAIGAWLAFAVGLQEYVGLLIPATWILSPFVYLQTSAITRDRPLLFWLPGWPGIAAIVVSITAMAVVYGTDIVLWQVGKLAIPEGLSWTLAIVLGLLTLVVEMFLTAYALLAWRHRWRWSQLAGEFRFARLAPCARVLAAVDLQLAWIAALLFVPLLLGGPDGVGTFGFEAAAPLRSIAPCST